MCGGMRLRAGADALGAALTNARAHAMDEGSNYRVAVLVGQGNIRVAPEGAGYWGGGTPRVIDQRVPATQASAYSSVAPPSHQPDANHVHGEIGALSTTLIGLSAEEPLDEVAGTNEVFSVRVLLIGAQAQLRKNFLGLGPHDGAANALLLCRR